MGWALVDLTVHVVGFLNLQFSMIPMMMLLIVALGVWCVLVVM